MLPACRRYGSKWAGVSEKSERLAGYARLDSGISRQPGTGILLLVIFLCFQLC